MWRTPFRHPSGTASHAFLFAQANSKLSATDKNERSTPSFAYDTTFFLSSSSVRRAFTKSAFALCHPRRYSCRSFSHSPSFFLSFPNISWGLSSPSSNDTSKESSVETTSSSSDCEERFGSLLCFFPGDIYWRTFCLKRLSIYL